MDHTKKMLFLLTITTACASYAMDQEGNGSQVEQLSHQMVVAADQQPHQDLSREQSFLLRLNVLQKTQNGQLSESVFPIELPENSTRILSTHPDKPK